LTPTAPPKQSAFGQIKRRLNSYRGQVFQRILACLILAYLLSNFAAIIFGLLLPTIKVDATLYAMLISFCFYTAAIMWVFSIKKTASMWRQLSLSTVGMGLLAAGIYYLEAIL